MKVLYVEDNPANVFLVKRVARMGQHEIVNYIDGNQAIQKFDEIKPDLVLMDIQLAGDKSGLDVVKELRAKGVKTPIIAVTAYAMVGDKERCIEAGCTDYLAKPLPIPRLVEIFKQYSDEVQAKAEIATQTATVELTNSEETEAKTETATTEEVKKADAVQSVDKDNDIVASNDEEKVVTSADDDTIVVQDDKDNKIDSADATDQPKPSANVAVDSKKEVSTGG